MFQSPSLLIEIRFFQQWMKNTIEIDREKITIVFGVLRREREHCPIGTCVLTYTYMITRSRTPGKLIMLLWLLTCKSIHECLQRTTDHFKERISNGIFVRTTQGCVFKDMCHSSTVHWYSFETNTGMRIKNENQDYNYIIFHMYMYVGIGN